MPTRRDFCLQAGSFAALAPLVSPARANVAAGTGDVVGRMRGAVLSREDTFIDVARRNNLGYVELVAANPGVDPWLPRPGELVTLPTAYVLPKAPREGLVINLAEMRLYYFEEKDAEPVSFAIGIGKEGNETPKGTTRIVRKAENPTWYPPESIRSQNPDLPNVVPPGPDNPLGTRALYFDWPAYLIHGTNKPPGVGRRVSHGCIRMYPEGVERLYEMVPVGTRVTVVEQTTKIGWRNGNLYIEVHPTGAQVDEIEATGQFTPEPVPDLEELILDANGGDGSRIDWVATQIAAEERRGIPVRITR